MTNRLLISIQTTAFLAVAALLFLSAGLAHASEVVGTLSSGTGSGSTATGTLSGGSGPGSTVTGTVTGSTSNTISGTVVSPGGVGGGADSSSGGSSHHSSNNNNNDGEVLGAQTEPTFGVGGGGDFPGVPNTGAGGALAYGLGLLGSAAAFAAGALALRRRYI